MSNIWKGAEVETIELPSGNTVVVNPSLSSWNLNRAGLFDEKYQPVLSQFGMGEGEAPEEIPMGLYIEFISTIASMVAVKPKILLDPEVAASREDSVFIGEVSDDDLLKIVEVVFGSEADDFPDDGSGDGNSQDSAVLEDNASVVAGPPSGQPSGGESQPNPGNPTQPGTVGGAV